jgi:PAS domain-containing protein
LDDGTERALHTQGEVIFNEKSTPIRMKGTVQDITESKQMEEALRESELKYRNIIETTNKGILVINGEIRITFVNKKLSEMLGYNLDEIIERSLFDFLDEEGKSVTRSNMKKRR